MIIKSNTHFLRNSISAKLISVIVFVLFVECSFAEAVSWVGPATGGDWTNAANWSGGVVPVATDSVLIAGGNVVNVSTDVGKINSAIIQGTLNITSTGILTIEQYVQSKALLQIEGGKVYNDGYIKLIQKTVNDVSGIVLADGTSNSTFQNTGRLYINMSLANATGDCITFKQTTGGTATFNAGGVMTFTPNTTNKTIFQNLIGNGQISGNIVIGSECSYKNVRLLQVSGGIFTFLANSYIEIYSGLTSGAIVLLDNTGNATKTSTAKLTNYGILVIHANALVASNAIQFSPGVYATSTLSNSGKIILDGTYSSSNGVILCGGTDATSYSVINNFSGGFISVTNTYGTSIATGGTTNSPALCASNTKNATINNAGTISLNSTGRSMYFGGNLCTFNNNTGGFVTVTSAITGSNLNTAACNFYNNTGATFDFNIPANPNIGTNVNAYTAISNFGKITFTNRGGTVMGRGAIMPDTFVPSTGIIAPGNRKGNTLYGQFLFSGATLDFSKSTFSLKIGGKTAGTSCDQLLIGTANAAVNISNSTLKLNFDTTYIPINRDTIVLIKSGITTPPNINGNFASTALPAGWALNYTSDITRLIYTTPTATTAPNHENTLNAKAYVVNNQIQVSLENNKSAVLSLTDLLGRKIIETALTEGQNSIETGNLKGVFIIQLRTGSTDYYSQKIVLF